jgi:hypothetical protein
VLPLVEVPQTLVHETTHLWQTRRGELRARGIRYV